jgi:hypothetical protein
MLIIKIISSERSYFFSSLTFQVLQFAILLLIADNSLRFPPTTVVFIRLLIFAPLLILQGSSVSFYGCYVSLHSHLAFDIDADPDPTFQNDAIRIRNNAFMRYQRRAEC